MKNVIPIYLTLATLMILGGWFMIKMPQPETPMNTPAPSKAPSFSENTDEKELITIDNQDYLILQEIINTNTQEVFRLLTTSTDHNRQLFDPTDKNAICFNGDTDLRTDSDISPTFYSLWEDENLINISKDPLSRLGFAPNGCISAWQWLNDDELIFQKRSGGGQEIIAFDTKTNEVTELVSYTIWFTGGLGESTTIQHVWSTPNGAFIQNEDIQTKYGDLYRLSAEEIARFTQYQDVIPTNTLAYETNGSFASSEILNKQTLLNLNNGLPFKLNNEEIFLTW